MRLSAKFWNGMLKASIGLAGAAILFSCASANLPEEHHSHYSFPTSRVYVEEPTGRAASMPYKVLGWVRTKEVWPTMEQQINNPGLCKNYYNKASQELLKQAKGAGGDAVVKVRSVIFNLDGTMQELPTPECSDDGAEGELLLRGIAIKFTPEAKSLKANVQDRANRKQPTVVKVEKADLQPVQVAR